MPVRFARLFSAVILRGLVLTLTLLGGAVRAAVPAPYGAAWHSDEVDARFREFRVWAETYETSAPADRAGLVAQGVALAKARRGALLELIQADPAAALGVAVPLAVRLDLPPEILAQLETRVRGTGDLSVQVVETSGARQGTFQRTVTLNGENYIASVYGRRASEATKENIPLHGIALDGAVALHESPARGLESGESGADPTRTVEIAGAILRFATPSALDHTLTQFEAVETGINPRPAMVSLLESSEGLIQESRISAAAGSNHSVGPQRVLIIPVDFSDMTGDPKSGSSSATYTKAYCQDFADNSLAPKYAHSSYGATTLATTVTPLLRLPQTAVYYASGQNASGSFIGDAQLRTDAQTAATAAGFDAASFDRVIVVHSNFTSLPGSAVGYGGVGEFGGRFVLINGALDIRVTAHELGHTYGLNHANLWQTTDGNAISSAGSSVEYGDTFDVMASGLSSTDVRSDFNPWYKNLLGWFSDAQVRTVTANGTFRLYAFDDANYAAAAGELVALRVPKDAGTDYWIGLRRNFTDNSAASHGAYIVWGYPTAAQRSNLLNFTTPGGDYHDAPLAVGRGFTDAAANLTVRVVAEGGTAPNYYIDVEVTLGNATPAFNAASSTATTITSGQTATFTAASSGNPAPTYRWQRLPAGSATWADLSEAGIYSGTRDSTLTVRSATAAMQGDQFRCIATNVAGNATSSAFTLNVLASIWQTYSGSPGVRQANDGPVATARFAEPNFITHDRAGNLYLTAAGNRTIRKITPQGVVSKIAGAEGVNGSADGTGAAAQFTNPSGIAVAADGTLYVADASLSSIRRISAGGVVTTFAGLSNTAGAVDGTGNAARFNLPFGLVIDSAGNLFVTDRNNQAIRKITPAGVVSTFAGTLGSAGSTDGTGAAARFNGPTGLAIDSADNLYVADSGNHVVRKITPAGVVSLYAGKVGTAGSADGGATATARFGSTMYGLAVDNDGNVYVSDTDFNIVRKISAGTVSTIGGLAGTLGSADGAAADARFSSPRGLTLDLYGNLYVADYGNSTVRRLLAPTATPAAPTVAALTRARYNVVGDVVRFEARVGGFPAPALQWQRSLDGGGTWQDITDDDTYSGTTAARLTIASAAAEMNGQQFRCIATNASGTATVPPSMLLVYSVTTLAGQAGAAGGTDGVGSAARFRDPRGLALDAAGNLFVADRGNHTIRKITPDGVVSTVAGSAGLSGGTNAAGAAARFSFPNAVAAASDGSLFVTDNTQTVRRIAVDGTVSTFAGTSGSSGYADGTGTAARFFNASGIAVDATGNVFVGDTNNQVIRAITASGVVTTLAGLAGTSGYVTVDGTGANARFNSPMGVSVAPDGSIYVADFSNYRIRSISAAGVVTTLAGTSNWGSTDGIGSAGWFDGPSAVAVDRSGYAYVADTNNNLVRLLTPAREVITIAGADVDPASADGPGRSARFNAPRGIAVDAAGVIYIADSGNHTIRRFGPAGGVNFQLDPPVIAAAPASQIIAAGNTAVFSVAVSSAAAPVYQWFKNGNPIAGAGGPSLVLLSVVDSDAGNYTVSATTAFGSVTSSAATLSVAAAHSAPPVAGYSLPAGEPVTLIVPGTTGDTPGFQWLFNGSPIAGATSGAFGLPNLQPANAGLYNVVYSAGNQPATGVAIIGITTTQKVLGAGAEIAHDIVFSNGNIFDQVLPDGAAVTVKADPGQIVRTSFLDLNNDIVQLEFSGAGNVSLVLDAVSGPAAPVNYNQATLYMKGHAGIVVTGADETTNLSVFSVGRGNAVNQSLFKSDVVYDGMADIAYIAILSPTGQFGGLRTANASYFATKGITGVYAPGVTFNGPVFIGDINARETASPVILLGSAANTQINGGDLLQTNGRAVAVSGISQLKFVVGSTSHNTLADPHLLPAQNNKARLEQDGVDVTAQIVVNPTP